ncbi:hypothetical protein D3C80_1686970 [compost metagenome]
MSKQHAEHNEKVCDLLIADGKFNDWIVTTAFYSALHYAQNEIFPYETGGVTYRNFNHYYSSLPNSKASKHTVTLRLVGSEMSVCEQSYRWLLDACHTARYKNYNISKKKASTAKSKLDKIKSVLTK